MKIAIASGYFNPIHIGHINYFADSKKNFDIFVVIVNNDEQVKLKGSVPFMPQEERMEIIKSIKHVDQVFLSVDKDRSVCESLKMVAKKYPGAELFFVNGGDRHEGNIPETPVLKELNIKTIDGVGGGKVQSSSWLLKNASDQKIEKN